ncbi:MAG TPA: class I SAM-dependent methyltransferase [Stellaceae bacterium]|jgi:SAM-dependent methyltransferase|nr:class I SAM-dependent methyltransferase [Stellaceae bacterium]
MASKRATAEQFERYKELQTQAWGGPEKVATLMESSNDYRRAFAGGVYGRYEGELNHITPWVQRLVPDVAERRLFEIGCGTGASTAAFATICKGVTAFDIDARRAQLAQERLQIFGAMGSTATAANFVEILNRLDAEDIVDGVLMFAVMEHMYPAERIEVLKRAWRKLPPGGIIVIGETPNRLCYFDPHTFLQPFANLLPPDLAKLWGENCVNDATRAAIKAAPTDNYMMLRDSLVRMGQDGLSFHEFELAISANVHECIISEEFDPEINDFNKPYRLEHDILSKYLRERTPHVNPVFAMPLLYLVIRKAGEFQPGTLVTVTEEVSRDHLQGVGLLQSGDALTERRKIIETLYRRILRRRPREIEFNYWVDRCNGLSSIPKIIDEFFEVNEKINAQLPPAL